MDGREVVVRLRFPPGTAPAGRVGSALAVRVYPRADRDAMEVALDLVEEAGRHYSGRDGRAVVTGAADGVIDMEWVPAGARGEGAV